MAWELKREKTYKHMIYNMWQKEKEKDKERHN